MIKSIQIGIQITNHNYTKIDYFADYFTHLYVCTDEIDIRQFNNVHSLTRSNFTTYRRIIISTY